jgi:hypothetical protein
VTAPGDPVGGAVRRPPIPIIDPEPTFHGVEAVVSAIPSLLSAGPRKTLCDLRGSPDGAERPALLITVRSPVNGDHR